MLASAGNRKGEAVTDDVSPYLKRPRRSLEEVIAAITPGRQEAPAAPEPAASPGAGALTTGDASRPKGG
jgi:hypothetical protein